MIGEWNVNKYVSIFYSNRPTNVTYYNEENKYSISKSMKEITFAKIWTSSIELLLRNMKQDGK